MKISVVMPVFNSEGFLRDAADSVLQQTLEDFELIMIDDCSQDKSPAICDEYAGKDSRVRVFHAPQNGGICKARNKGIELAQGDYIAFCDDDDLYMPELLRESYDAAVRNNADIVKYGRKLIDVDRDGKVLRTKETKSYGLHVYQGEEICNHYFEMKSRGYVTNLWNGIYRTSIVKDNHICFDESMKFGSEDMDFTLRVLDLASCVVIDPKTYYVHYRRDSSSTSRKFSQNKIDSLVKVAAQELRIRNKMPGGTANEVLQNRMAAENFRNIITIQLLHKDCPYRTDEKVQMLSRLADLPQFAFSADSRVMKKLKKEDAKAWVTVFLTRKRWFRLLIAVLGGYRHFLGDRW